MSSDYRLFPELPVEDYDLLQQSISEHGVEFRSWLIRMATSWTVTPDSGRVMSLASSAPGRSGDSTPTPTGSV